MSQKASVDMAYIASVKELARKYVNVMHDSLKKQTDVDARQQVYYCAYGATLAMFEMLANLIAFIPKSQREHQVRVQQVAQEILTMCSGIEAARQGEAMTYEVAMGDGASQGKH
jgi:hypothetical protein